MSKTEQTERKPLVSVVSPVYNGRGYLLPFVESVMDQTLKNWELIIVDDGSTDDSVAIAEEQASMDPRIKVIRAEHKNAGNARNIGFEQVRGEYTCFLDSDDVCKPDMLKHMYEAAVNKNADIVMCLTESYSQRTRYRAPMSWAVRDNLIPETEDGCYNRHSCKEYLFQSCIISPWNKMIRTEILRRNKIKAQSQLAANDVVLSCTALACAERIYVLHEILYMQRRDYAGSITSNLGTEEKCMCGYTASLGLLEELRRLGIYEELRETYQRLAIHNCMWYMDKQYESVGILQNYYDFLKKEGFSNMDLDELEAGILREENDDYKMFADVRSKDLTDYLYQALDRYRKKEEADSDKIKRIEKEYLKAKNSKDYNVGRKVLYIPRKVKNFRKTINRVVSKSKGNNRYKKAGRRIAVFAFEKYHYEVIENIIRICNMEDNYIIAYVNNEAYKEISHMLGEEKSGLVEWHTFRKPDIKPALDKFAPYDEKRKAFVEHALGREGLDCIIIPSVEYHPDWYEGLALSKKEGAELILGLHNLNNVFAEGRRDMLSVFLEKADSYFVISSELKDTMEDLGIKKKIYIFPSIYEPSERKSEKKEDGCTVFTVTGIVDRNRKDYQMLVDALRTIPDLYSKIKIVLLGNADNDYGRGIAEQMKELGEKGLRYDMYFNRIPQSVFDEVMEQTDCLVGPVMVETSYKGSKEYYGRTKASGIIGDIVKYGLPAIVTGEMAVPEELESSIISYASTDELGEAMKKLSESQTLEDYKNQAKKNSEKFTLDKHLWK